jgi:undecaprenyl-diphosphatase
MTRSSSVSIDRADDAGGAAPDQGGRVPPRIQRSARADGGRAAASRVLPRRAGPAALVHPAWLLYQLPRRARGARRRGHRIDTKRTLPMTWWDALVLGVIQGVTEFFPVSSSGHLVMGTAVLGLALPGIIFEVAVHVATLISVLIVYRDRVWRLLLGLLGREDGADDAWPYALKLVLASVPAVIVGFAFKDWFEARFDDPVFAATMVLVTGCIVWSIRWARADTRVSPLEAVPIAVAAGIALLAGTLVPFVAVLAIMALLFAGARLTARREWQPQPSWSGALLMGIGQAAAILPGITRSGSTVLTGAWRRIDPIAAAEFSFLMSVIAITGAGLLMVPDALDGGESIGMAPLLIGALAAMVSGILAIRFFLALLRRQNFHVFAWYCWAAGGLFLLFAR